MCSDLRDGASSCWDVKLLQLLKEYLVLSTDFALIGRQLCRTIWCKQRESRQMVETLWTEKIRAVYSGVWTITLNKIRYTKIHQGHEMGHFFFSCINSRIVWRKGNRILGIHTSSTHSVHGGLALHLSAMCALVNARLVLMSVTNILLGYFVETNCKCARRRPIYYSECVW